MPEMLKFCLREEMGVTKIFILGSNVNVNKTLNVGDNDSSRERSCNLYAETNISHLLPSGILCSIDCLFVCLFVCCKLFSITFRSYLHGSSYLSLENGIYVYTCTHACIYVYPIFMGPAT